MKEKICPETNQECEYKPADDEPCHQCRIFRNMQDDKIVSCFHTGLRGEVNEK